MAAWIPWREATGANATLPAEPPARLGLALALAFQLLNTVEEHAAESMRHLRESAEGAEAERGLWADQLAALKRAGIPAPTIAAVLAEVEVEPVFTAHPTEAKRTSVLEQHRALLQLLQSRRGATSSSAVKAELLALLERLWRTGEILLEKPSVADERRNLLHYLREVLPGVVGQLDRRLETAWTGAGLPGAPASRPRLSFGTWVGGDRDGHPGVTAAVTAETLEQLRANSLLVLHRELMALADRLPLSEWVQPPPPGLRDLRDRITAQLGEAATAIRQRHPGDALAADGRAAGCPVAVGPTAGPAGAGT